MPWRNPHPWFNLYILQKDKSPGAVCGLVILGHFCLLEILHFYGAHFLYWKDLLIWWLKFFFFSFFMLILFRYFNRGRKHYCSKWNAIVMYAIAKLGSHILVYCFCHTLLLIYSAECFKEKTITVVAVMCCK